MGKVKFWLIAGWCAAVSVPTWAQQTPCGPYRVALYEYGSLAFQHEGQKPAGIDVDIVEEVGRRTGCKFQTFMDSRVRTWADLAQGDLDMTVSAIETEERHRFARYVIYMKGRNRLLIRNDVPGAVHSLQEFTAQSQLRLAVVKSFKHGLHWDQWINTLRQQGRVDEYADANTAARLVAQGRNAAFFSEPVVWGRILEDSKLEGKVTVIDAFPSDNYSAGFAMAKGKLRDDDIQRIQAAISAMRVDGTLLKIFGAYLPHGEAVSSMP